MGPRGGLSVVLILGALVLLAAIALGDRMGSRVLGGVARRVSAAVTPIPITTPSPAPPGSRVDLRARRREVLSVATDPAFPDPRITPEPTPPPTPRPTPRPTRVPTPSPSPSRRALPEPLRSNYTSPPLPMPLASAPASALPTSGASSPAPSRPAAVSRRLEASPAPATQTPG